MVGVVGGELVRGQMVGEEGEGKVARRRRRMGRRVGWIIWGGEWRVESEVVDTGCSLGVGCWVLGVGCWVLGGWMVFRGVVAGHWQREATVWGRREPVLL